MSKNLIAQAKEFAIQAHNSIDHLRKYSEEPYWLHAQRVAEMVADVTKDQEIIAAAWMHDILEDVAPLNPNFDSVAIQNQFGERVLQLVLEVTDVSVPTDGNRATRKAIDREHLQKASAAGKTIKLADLIDNFVDIAKYDEHFLKVFKGEALLSLPILKGGNSELYKKLEGLLNG